MKPLAIDLFCGLGGWTSGLLAEGYDVIGFDIERHVYGEHRYPAQLVIQDVLTLHGSQFRDASLIVASPPCQEFSYMAMPWSRAKAKAAAIRADETGQMRADLTRLFDAGFRIQREACEAAGRHIPMVVENVRGANEWVGRSRWSFGSFHLWGDVPTLMPSTAGASKMPGHSMSKGAPKWNTQHSESCVTIGLDGLKQPGINLSDVGFNVAAASEFGHMVEGAEYRRSDDDKRQHIGVKRKFASAMIAKIPEPLSRHIAATFRP